MRVHIAEGEVYEFDLPEEVSKEDLFELSEKLNDICKFILKVQSGSVKKIVKKTTANVVNKEYHGNHKWTREEIVQVAKAYNSRDREFMRIKAKEMGKDYKEFIQSVAYRLHGWKKRYDLKPREIGKSNGKGKGERW